MKPNKNISKKQDSQKMYPNHANQQEVFDYKTKKEYLKSFKQMATDIEILAIAEEGMNDYLVQID